MNSRASWDTFETFSILLRQENRYTIAYFSTEIDDFDGFKTFIGVFLKNERPKKAQYRMRFPVLHLGFGAIYGFKAKNKFRIG